MMKEEGLSELEGRGHGRGRGIERDKTSTTIENLKRSILPYKLPKVFIDIKGLNRVILQ